MTEDEFKTLADKIGSGEATSEDKRLFLSHIKKALGEVRSLLQ